MTRKTGVATWARAISPALNRVHATKPLSKTAKLRLSWMDYHRTHGNNAALTCRHFGLTRSCFYKWRKRFRAYGPRGLEEVSRRPQRVRKPLTPTAVVDVVRRLRKANPELSKYKLAVILGRDHGYSLSASTVGRILTRYDLFFTPPIKPKRHPQRLKNTARMRKPRQLAGILPGDLIEVEVEAELAVRQSAREAAANERRRAFAGRLEPYIGRLVIVSNFKGVRLEENAARISSAVLAATNLGADMPIGISAVLSYHRSNHESLIETADALTASFAGSVGGGVFPVRAQRESSDFWLLALARAAEDTAGGSMTSGKEGLGCIAVSALDMNRQANIPDVPAPGTAFKLVGISEEARFGWETISLPDYQ